MDKEAHRILLVDDEPDITISFKAMLEQRGFKVDTFNNPLDAIGNFKPGVYGLLLLDIRMPEMDGFKLYEELKKLDKEVKAVFISAFDINSEALRSIYPELRVESFIRKPVDSDSLTKIMKQELERRHEN